MMILTDAIIHGLTVLIKVHRLLNIISGLLRVAWSPAGPGRRRSALGRVEGQVLRGLTRRGGLPAILRATYVRLIPLAAKTTIRLSLPHTVAVQQPLARPACVASWTRLLFLKSAASHSNKLTTSI